MWRTIIGCIMISIFSCSKYDKPPVRRLLPPIKLTFYVCNDCNSMEGGIYGKGPLRKYKSEKAKKCIHNWKEISKEEFKTIASQIFNVDWSKETEWWKR